MELALFKAGFEAHLECCEIENNRFLGEYLKLGAISQILKWKKLALRAFFTRHFACEFTSKNLSAAPLITALL